MTYQDIKNNDEINAYIRQADQSLSALGYTEHSFAHVTLVAEKAGYILSTLVDQIINNGYIKLPLFLLRKSRPIDISNDKQQAHDLLLQNTYRFSGQVLLSISPVFPAASVLSFC